MQREAKHKTNGGAGAQSVEYWRMANREDMTAVMRPYLEKQTEALAGIEESIGKLTYIAERHWR